MTFIRGRLRLLGGAVLEIVGNVVGSGIFNWSGPWNMSGKGTITGNVDSTGVWNQDGDANFTEDVTIQKTLDVSAETTLRGLTKLLADLVVQSGGRIIVGNVTISPNNNGTITVGVGSARVVVEGSTGRIRAGSLTIDPTEGGGAVVFDNGAQVYSNPTNNQIEMFSGDVHVTLRDGQAAVASGTKSIILQEAGNPNLAEGIYAVGVPNGAGGSYLGLDSNNRLVKLSSGGGGDPGNPPAGNPDGYIWPADPAVYGISDDFAAHVARGSAEPGVDVMTPVGAPLWAPGPGTVTAVQTSPAGATGRYVTFVTDAGDWFRFLHNSSIVVSVGQHVEQATLLAYTGGSGFGSEAYYGPHTHISFKAGYTGSFPGASALDDFEAYMAAA
ncbi:M23 family metallopeptidase [Microbacterium sp. KNMS]